MPRFRVTVSYVRTNQSTLNIRASDTMSSRQKAQAIVDKWEGIKQVKVEEVKLDE